ncbi:MAG: NAD-dependent epimerase/dehydratase family protein [Synergistaceae bacterium]|jgi:nucleoside-diphosphate-sugar epimerase|nr:NAD-dependent epimerase/dehydratase family protein [Synergistaceae bacterium]
MKNRVLVTGATGFTGKYLVPALLSRGHDVRVLVRNESLAQEAFGESCEIFKGDVTVPESLKNCCEGVDTVYHLAALMGHDLPSAEAFERFRRVNLYGTSNLVRECKAAGIKRFVHLSSTAAMGLLKEASADERSECKPWTPYQVTKYEGERFLLNEYEANGFPVIVVRPSMVYGPGFKGDFLTMARVCGTGFFPRIGRGQNLSPALYITDLIGALTLFLEKGSLGEIYLVSSARSYSLREAAEIIGGALHKKVRFVYVPVWAALMGAGILEKLYALKKKPPPVTRRNIRSVVTDRVFDIGKASAVGFAQKVPLEVGLRRTVEYYIQQNYIQMRAER